MVPEVIFSDKKLALAALCIHSLDTLSESDEMRRLRQENAELQIRVTSLRFELEDLKRRLFGPRSEKLDSRQLQLAWESVEADQKLEEQEPPIPAEASTPKKKGGGRRPAPANLPVERVVLDLPEEQKVGLVKIREEVTEEIDYHPSRFIRRLIVRPVYADAANKTAPVIMPLPARVIPQSGAGTGLLVHTVISKYADHQPLYRQEQIAARHGLDLPRQKLSRWTEEVALLLKGLTDQIRHKVLESGYVQVDETPVRVLDPDRPGKAAKAWLWPYHAPGASAIYFDFHLSRGRDSPRQFFPPDWKGVLQSDGYEAYESLLKERPGIVRKRPTEIP